MNPAPPVLAIEDLTIDYGGHRSRSAHRAVEGVSLDVAAGDTVGLVGESGSGKSTIARAVLGLVPVTSGKVFFAGKDITHASHAERKALARDLQAVFQDPTSSLNPARTVGAALAEPLAAQGIRERSAVRERVRVMLEAVGLPPESAGRYPAQFSAGQRQRVCIARALMLSPRLVICDEVVSALDLSVQAQVLNLLAGLQADTRLSYLFISHDPAVVRHVCDRVVVLYSGHVVESGPVARVMSAPAHPCTAALLAAAPVPNPREQRARRVAVADASRALVSADMAQTAGPLAASSGCPFSGRCAYAKDNCREQAPTMRLVAGGVRTACHRYPEWLHDPPGTARPGEARTSLYAQEETLCPQHLMGRRPPTADIHGSWP